jgi:hypothetical protein
MAQKLKITSPRKVKESIRQNWTTPVSITGVSHPRPVLFSAASRGIRHPPFFITAVRVQTLCPASRFAVIADTLHGIIFPRC